MAAKQLLKHKLEKSELIDRKTNLHTIAHKSKYFENVVTIIIEWDSISK